MNGWQPDYRIRRSSGPSSKVYEPSMRAVRKSMETPLLVADAVIETGCQALWCMVGTGEVEEFPFRLLKASTETMSAVVRLCERGYGDQASMLFRSLYEAMLTSYWYARDPEVAQARLAMQHEHTWDLMAKVTANNAPLPIMDLPYPDVDAQRQDELRSAFGEWGTRGLTGQTDWELTQALLDEWDEVEAGNLRLCFNTSLRFANIALHTSAVGLGIGRLVPAEEPERLEPCADSDVMGPLYASFWSYSRQLDLYLKTYEPQEHDAFRELYEAGQLLFGVRAANALDEAKQHVAVMQQYASFLDELRHVDGGTAAVYPCPCGSGRQYADCCSRAIKKTLRDAKDFSAPPDFEWPRRSAGDTSE